MRLVKRTVNQDDTSAYHLFYADGLASPGSDLTFFDWPVGRERRGGNSVTRTGLRVSGAASLEWWAGRLREAGVQHGAVSERDGRAVLDFEDPEGQRLSLVDDGGAGEGHPWARSPVPPEHQIRGLGPVEMTVPVLGPTEAVLTGVMGMRHARAYAVPDETRREVHVYEMGEGGGPAAELHVAVRPDLEPARPGAGGVHHVAFRTPDEAEYRAWAERLAVCASRTPARWTGTTSAASTSASPAACCSRSPPTGRASPWTSRWSPGRAPGAAALPRSAARGASKPG
jgi:glyoxalase family protein